MSTTSTTDTNTDTDPPPAAPAPAPAPAEDQTLIPNLPNDISLNILARIPRTRHPHLSLVSKTFLALLTSPLYFKTRTQHNFTQPQLYISLRIRTSSTPQWFTLHQNPNPKSIKGRNFLVPVPPTPAPLVGSAFVSDTDRIYVVGGSINDVPSAQVWVLDCRFNRWECVGRMKVGREFPAAGVVDGKVYVIGGCVVDSFARDTNWAEVYDPVAGTWEPVESSGGGGAGVMIVREKWMHASAVIDGKVYAMADRDGVVYNPRRKEWSCVEKRLDLGWRGRACVVDRVLYCYDYLGKIRGFDVVDKAWRELRGVEKELPKFLCGATMANFGGKLVVVWERKEGKKVQVWCAEISVKKRRKEGGGVELWGEVVWCDVVHKVSVGSAIVHCLAVTL